jgi:hypothetical protein
MIKTQSNDREVYVATKYKHLDAAGNRSRKKKFKDYGNRYLRNLSSGLASLDDERQVSNEPASDEGC